MKTIISILVLSISLFFVQCKKNQTGGKATVKGTVLHHSKPIADAFIYIKFNTTEFPGADYTKYDTYVKADGNGNYTIPLYKGNYYLFAKGFDLDIPAPHTVIGGISVSVRNKENLTKTIAVTEGD